MIGRNTFNLLFHVRKGRKDSTGMVPVYLRVTVNGKSSTISINRKVSLTAWDDKRGRVKQKIISEKSVNDYIETINVKAFEAHKQLLDDGKAVTPESIVAILLGKKERDYTLLKIVEKHNTEMKRGLGISSSYGNFKNYKTSQLYIQEFIETEYKQKDMLLSDLDLSFIKQYVYFLQTVKSCHHNGAMKQVQRLNKILNLAIDHGWITKNPFNSYKIKFKPYDKIILDWEELQKVENLANLTPKLSIIKDAFIFSCYTGLAYIDVKNLTREYIVTGVNGKPWIITRRTKTETKSRIPLLPIPLALIEKYKGHPKLKVGHVIPIFSNQKTNDYLKDLADAAGIKKKLSFHCARHIFATVITLSNGVPIETVSKMLGHKDIRTTQIYSKVVDEKISHDFGELTKRLDDNEKRTG